jgi:hypothetical protein
VINGFLTFVLPLTNGDFREPIYPAYVWFASIETVCTLVIIWQAWFWARGDGSAFRSGAPGTCPVEASA